MSHRLFFFGSSAFGMPSLEAVLAMPDVTIAAVVSQPAKPVGRKATVTSTPIADWATEHSINLLTPTSLRTADTVTAFKNLEADTFIVASYGLILPQSVLAIPKYQCLNIHASLLPKYRGASPIAAAIIAGESETGISFMLMDTGVDTGPVLEQHTLPIVSDETTRQLEHRLAKLAAEKIPGLLQAWWENKIQPQPQAGKSSYAPILKTDDGRAGWESATALERKIRAFQPWPGVWTTWQGQRVKILSATVELQNQSSEPGTIVHTKNGLGWGVACHHGVLVPSYVQLAGKKTVAASTLPGSYPNFIGSRFD